MNNRQLSPVHSDLKPGQVRALKGFRAEGHASLRRLGITMDSRNVRLMQKAYNEAMDALQPDVTTPSIATPVQFLQNWLPGFVEIITASRKADDVLGLMTTGSWEDEQVVQQVLERTGYSVPYSDYGNVPFSSWNVNFVFRTVVRFEEGMVAGNLETARAARMRIDNSSAKREGAALALEIIRNTVAFFGFNAGNNNTYGFLNDPNLSGYVSLPNGASGFPTWATKTFLEIQKDIIASIVNLRTSSQDTIDPEKLPLSLIVATDVVDNLAKTSDFGISVREWLSKAYPLVRVVSAPQLNNANGGANVFYMQADKVMDSSTDGGRVWIQPVPAKFMVMGVQQLAKGYEEDYSNATAGAMLKRPYAVVRYTGC